MMDNSTSICLHALLAYRYEWIFIRDTIDVINHSLEWSPYALMDRLGEKFEDGQQHDVRLLLSFSTQQLSQLTVLLLCYLSCCTFLVSQNYHVPIHPNTSAISPSKGEFKRPMLTAKSITSIRQLRVSFFCSTYISLRLSINLHSG